MKERLNDGNPLGIFVSGYGFSHIEKAQTTVGFSRWPRRLKADRICSLRHA